MEPTSSDPHHCHTKYETSATSDALLQEIELQKRIEMWGEGRRLFDMKRRNESLDYEFS